MSATTATNAIVLPADTLLDKAIAVVLWWLGLCWLVPVMTVMMVLAFIVHPEKTEWLSRLYCRGQVFVTGSRWRAEVDPAVDPQATYLFAQNHINLLDHVTMYPATPHFKQGIELESHFKIPIYGWFMKQRGTLAVRRGDRRALSKLKEGFAAEDVAKVMKMVLDTSSNNFALFGIGVESMDESYINEGLMSCAFALNDTVANATIAWANAELAVDKKKKKKRYDKILYADEILERLIQPDFARYVHMFE